MKQNPIFLSLVPTRKVLLEKCSVEIEMREFFLEKLDGCEIKTYKDYPDYIFYGKNGKTLFEKHTKNKWFYVRYDEIWSVFEGKYGLTTQQTRAFIKDLLDETLKFEGLTPSCGIDCNRVILDETLKFEGLTSNSEFDYEPVTWMRL